MRTTVSSELSSRASVEVSVLAAVISSKETSSEPVSIASSAVLMVSETVLCETEAEDEQPASRDAHSRVPISREPNFFIIMSPFSDFDRWFSY